MTFKDIWEQHGTTIALAIGAIVVLGIAYKVLMPKKKVFVEGMTLNVKCRSCDWQGTVTKYNKTCRKCNGSDLASM